MKKITISLLSIYLSCFLCSNFASEYPYEPSRIILDGTLEIENHYGPPNYGETPKIDQQVKILVIKLSESITVGTKSSLSELNFEVVENVECIQVYFKNLNLTYVKKLIGKKIKLIGMLSYQIGPRDFHRIILRNASLINKRRNQWGQ